MTSLIKSLTNEIDRLLGGEIKELKFGCRIRDKKTDKVGMIIGERIVFGSEADYGFNLFVWEKEIKDIFLVQDSLDKIYKQDLSEYSEADFEILGRPINLEDVMRAIGKCDGERGLLVDRNGLFYRPDTLKPLNIGCAWELGKPLSLQSPETVDKISEILNVK